MEKFQQIFGSIKPIIGMVHLKALPGTPKYQFSSQQIIDIAVEEALVFKKLGLDAIMIENMHDVPYTKGEAGPEITALMSVIAKEIKTVTDLTLGIQVLAGANKSALAVAKASGAEFIRAEGFVFGHLADEGYIDAQAGDLMRFRKHIEAKNIAVFTDIKKKHSSHAVTKDISLLDTAKAAQFFLSDGVIVTGNHTGESVSMGDLEGLKNKLNIPVLIGSGLTDKNIQDYLHVANAFIVGSYFKKEGYWENSLDEDRISRFLNVVNN